MSDKSSAGGDGPVARSGPSQAPRQRSSIQKTQERRRALIISCCGALLIAALTAVVLIRPGSPTPAHTLNSPQSAMAMPDLDLRAAKITNDSDGKGCWRQIFDNQTGRMTRSQQPCETTAYDSSGAPIPVGTIHRLQEIRKSFSGH
jgi:hypothetical protein